MRQLDKDGITYTKIDVTEDAEAAERLKRNGFTEAPVFGFAGKLKTIADLPEIRKHILSSKEAA